MNTLPFQPINYTRFVKSINNPTIEVLGYEKGKKLMVKSKSKLEDGDCCYHINSKTLFAAFPDDNKDDLYTLKDPNIDDINIDFKKGDMCVQTIIWYN